ncbi:MAG: EamA family transporter [Betaproteobacteria bacterium]|nr:EamA family transporter [Betaproteobacteria bacterium]
MPPPRASRGRSVRPSDARSCAECSDPSSEAAVDADATPTDSQRRGSHVPADLSGSGVGAILVFLAATGFATKSILIKLAYRYGVDATALFALRQIFAAPLFAAMAWWSRDAAATRSRPSRRDWFQLAGLGLLGYYVAAWLDFLGLRYVSAALERLLLFLYPTIVVLLSAWLLGVAITRRQLVALFISYAGIGLVFFAQVRDTGGSADLAIGATMILLSAIAYSLYLIGSSRVVHRFGAIRFTAWAMLAATVVGVSQFAATHGLDALRLPLPVYGLCAVMAVFATVLPALLMTEGLRRIGASQAALVGTIGPVITMILAAEFLGETMGPVQVVGATLVLAGVLVVSRRDARVRR